MPHAIADKSLCEQKQVRSRSIFGVFDYLLVFGLLGALIGLPILILRDLFRSATTPLLRQGEWRILKASRATVWMALMLIMVPIGVLLSFRSEISKDPTFPIFQSSGSIIGLIGAALAILFAVWLVLRMRWRKIRYNNDTLIAGSRKYSWSDLSFAGYQKRTVEVFYMPVSILRSMGIFDGSKLTLQFGTSKKIVVYTDMEGRADFIKELKQIAKKQKVKFITEKQAM